MSTGSTAPPGALTPGKFSGADIRDALHAGWHEFRAMPGPSMAFAALFGAFEWLLTLDPGHNLSPPTVIGCRMKP